ncbi:hypothetical protein LEP1GSC185_1162 [Leptospira licerasiae serovar Varillal str. VAR 010]|uniref:Uncharacterized protein n=1 Tax=Leptospira licerasiae str. MMD4847 TaxID=1049971 RepID=A0ABN0HAE6_9LEPT|nr:hypothetical protein LEP1GSC185_1162 [Leptospira licerasiae serovar Varillal str. VAR 010]EJZ42720.1 hypothetical protein LEP1GSC178_3381 [Leptospira licerasiae str. MMD4847]
MADSSFFQFVHLFVPNLIFISGILFNKTRGRKPIKFLHFYDCVS